LPLIGAAQEGRAVMSTINRNTGTHQPESTTQASTGTAHVRGLSTYQQVVSSDSMRGLASHHGALSRKLPEQG
jgi:hypothetical protein